MTKRTHGCLVLAAALAMLLVAAPAASAGTIRFAVPPHPEYEVQDNGQGIVKIIYRTCVTAGVRQQLSFRMMVNVTNQDSNATFDVLRAEGDDVQFVFDPASVFLERGGEREFAINFAFTVPSANNKVTSFRIKLEPESGEGLGEGAGIMIQIPCVLAAASPPAAGQPSQPSQPPTTPTTPTTPTAGFFPAPASPQAAPDAPCISFPQKVRVRAGERSVIRVRVNVNQTDIRNALVRVRGAGIDQRRRTGTDGIATFTIRPTRRGTLVVQSDVCFGADRARVLGARRAQAPARPRFTG